MDVGDFLGVTANGDFQRVLQRYTQALLTQIAQGAACNRLHTVDERAARWLLMTHDRVGADEFPLTQEFLAQMLGVRRQAANVAERALAEVGLISYSRGRVTVLDRDGLREASCACYELITGEFERLLGP
jgi:CRP-like cAMP-binding protein